MVKGEVTIRQFKSILIVITVLLVTACSESEISSKTKESIEYFTSKEKALEHYIENENVKGNIDLIKTTKDEELLVTQWSENNYFVGELKKDNEGFYAVRISAYVHMEIGASWELITIDGTEYTIFFNKDKENSNFIPLSNKEYYVAVVEGHKLSENKLTLTNAILDIEDARELLVEK